MNSTPRSGVLAAGTFVLDHVKVIDAWPAQDMLANITSESNSNGGGPYNVLKDLAALGAKYPLAAAGLLGDDPDGRWISDDCAAHGINIQQLHTTAPAPTSYTDAMCVESDGRRTFFHQRGANASFSRNHLDLTPSNAKILLLAYLPLLDAMDRLDGDRRTSASRLLEEARALGFLTGVETASVSHPRFSEVIIASLPHTDMMFLNETEASLLLGRKVALSSGSLVSAAGDIAALGAPGRVIVHCVRGAVCHEPDGLVVTQPSLALPQKLIRGSTGAGDAFTAGFLHGVHEKIGAQQSLLQGVCAAAQSLSHPTASGGMAPLGECMELANRYPFQSF